MKEIIVGTTNKNKVKRIQNLFKEKEYIIKDLSSLNKEIDEPEENGKNPIDISIEKAMHYVNYCNDSQIVLTQDDTLVFENISDEDSPGMHIKAPVIKKYGEFTDELAAKYYTDLANKYGGYIPITFIYGHSVAMIDNKRRKKKIIFSAESKLKARIVNKINKLETVPGYFLSAIMQVKINGKWKNHNDLSDEEKIKIDNDLYKSIDMLLKKINKF